MKKFIRVLLLINGDNVKPLEITFESMNGLHELEIYTALEKLFPRYIFIDYNVDENIFHQGYNIIYKNNLESVVIYRA